MVCGVGLWYAPEMNYFAHARSFLDKPYFVAGTGVPDMLAVVDRRVRVRRKNILPLVNDRDEQTAAVAGGMLQHLKDDARFHETRAFAELSLQFTVTIRDVLDAETGLRPNFLGHLLVELLLDATLCAECPDCLAQYYRVIGSVDPHVVETVVNRTVAKPTNRLAPMFPLLRRERFLYDYSEDDKLMVRLNQIMRRVRLQTLPDKFCSVLPNFRKTVRLRKDELLDGIPT